MKGISATHYNLQCALRDADNEGLPDVAYQAFCVEGVEAYNDSYGASLDPLETSILWLEKRADD